MATNLAIDIQLLENALRVSKLKTKRETVNLALEEFVKRRLSAEIIELFGSIDFDEDYDYKQARKHQI